MIYFSTYFSSFFFFFFFNDTATTEIYTLSLHDALPILPDRLRLGAPEPREAGADHLHVLGAAARHERRGSLLPHYGGTRERGACDERGRGAELDDLPD